MACSIWRGAEELFGKDLEALISHIYNCNGKRLRVPVRSQFILDLMPILCDGAVYRMGRKALRPYDAPRSTDGYMTPSNQNGLRSE